MKHASARYIRETLNYVIRFNNALFTVVIDTDTFEEIDQMHLIRDIMLLRACNIRLVLVVGTIKQAKGDILEQTVQQIRHLMDSMSMTQFQNQESIYCIAEHVVQCREPGGLMVNITPLNGFLSQGLTPIVPVATNDGQMPLLLQAALQIACGTGSLKLIFLTNCEGIYQNQALLRQLHPNEVKDLIENGSVSGYLEQLAQAANNAVAGGVKRVHIINSLIQGNLLLEICSRDGVGTMIYQGPYREIRPAVESDIVDIVELLESYSDSGAVRQLSAEEVREKITHFFVAVIDNQAIGCGCVRTFPAEGKAFISSVAIHSQYIKEGIGNQLLNALEEKAISACKNVKISLVSPRTGGWWLHQEYEAGALEDLPQELLPQYRNTHPTVLIK